MNTKALAEEIADRLFINGSAQRAKRLVLELDNKKDGGGWCRQAAINQIKNALDEQVAKES